MKLFTLLLLLGCSGPAFTSKDSINDKGNDPSTSGGGVGETQESGGIGGVGGQSNQNGGQLEQGGGSSGAMAGSPPQAGSSGASTLAGRPAMGEGGTGGEAMGGPTISSCLANHQTLACAQVCDSSPYCQGILDCFVSHDSDLTTDCPGFNDTGYSLALEAERNCCHD